MNRLFAAALHPKAHDVVRAPAASASLQPLSGHKYCLVVTHRKDGRAVPTPVWFGIAGEKVYFRTAEESGKLKRIRRNPRALVAACTSRGKPLADPIAGSARVLDGGEADVAERAIAANYGTGRRLYERTAASVAPPELYVEFTPE